MTSPSKLEWRQYAYFPYERVFAQLEAERLSQSAALEGDCGLILPDGSITAANADRLTYFGRVVLSGGREIIPQQARLEASAHSTTTERQATRYSAHGLHEYKGKFNPQVVRAIGNILGLQADASVLDPFCGSGTTILECAHAGWDAVGVDRNPLAVRITNAKIHALKHIAHLQALGQEVDQALEEFARPLCELTSGNSEAISVILGREWSTELSDPDYLMTWFPLPVLAQLVAIQRVLGRVVRRKDCRAVFDVVLSDYLRRASLQDPGDLRIRRRKQPAENYPIIDWFRAGIHSRFTKISRARDALGSIRGTQRAELADTREINWSQVKGRPRAGFDAIITSPPYETALPYIDTQRLSLVLLGDIVGAQVSETERALIGARDLGRTERRQLEQEIREGTAEVPPSVLGLCRDLLSAAAAPGNGFRRVARPALVLRYFKGMASFFAGSIRALRPGGVAALVVGSNRTVLGGREFVIDTPRLLADVARHTGYLVEDLRSMDTYPRYDLHQKNSIDSEQLVILRAK